MLIGITGEKMRVKNAGSILQDFLRFFSKIQEVDSFCKQVFFYGTRELLASNRFLVSKSKKQMGIKM